MQIVFGPIVSRRFGISLGVDLSPNTKQCNFDCLYCELSPKKTINKYEDVIPVEEIIKEVKEALKKHEKIDVLTITANGEPTLYPHLEEFIRKIKPHIKNNIKTLILSNGSKFGEEKIQNALMHFDIVKFSLDSIDIKQFKKVDRPHAKLNLDSILDGIKSFSKIRKNLLICEILFVKNINDNLDSIAHLVEFLKDINVDRVDLSTIDRPPAYSVEALSFDKLYEISEMFDGLNISLPIRKNVEFAKPLVLSEDSIISLLKRRPIDINEANYVFSKSTLENLKNALLNNKVVIKKVVNTEFYTLKNN